MIFNKITLTSFVSPRREAWNKLGHLSKELAMARYISLVNELDPGWETKEISVEEVVREIYY